jgi:hypothetical protein
LDLALENSASGFIPNMEDGIVGLNWNLMAGGMITRQVNWSPDDMDVHELGDQNENLNVNIGYIYGMLGANLGTYSGDYIKTLGFLDFSNPQTIGTKLPYEYSPDVFSFNFNGHTGRFFLGNDGVVKVSADRNYKVDLSGMSGQTDLLQSFNSSTIAITTDEGDIYTFGGDFSALQITYPSAPGGTGITGTGAAINAWYLVSIRTHNGRTITFHYEQQSWTPLAQYPGTLTDAMDYIYGKFYYSEILGQEALRGGEQNIGNAGQPPTYSVIKTVYLQSIVTPTTEIDFSYSQKAHEFYGTAALVGDHHKPNELDQIQIKDADGNPIKNITMEYIANGNTTVGYRNF